MNTPPTAPKGVGPPKIQPIPLKQAIVNSVHAMPKQNPPLAKLPPTPLPKGPVKPVPGAPVPGGVKGGSHVATNAPKAGQARQAMTLPSAKSGPNMPSELASSPLSQAPTHSNSGSNLSNLASGVSPKKPLPPISPTSRPAAGTFSAGDKNPNLSLPRKHSLQGGLVYKQPPATIVIINSLSMTYLYSGSLAYEQ